jgi:TrkA domain protein
MSTFHDPVTEQDLPGIGRRYQMTDDSGHLVTVIVHHSGRRDVYLPNRGAGDVTAVSFTDDQARRLGALLAGVYFKPAVVAQVEAVIGGLLIDWVTLHEGSPGVGRSIADLEIRRKTRMTIAAIVRGEASLVAPDPTTALEVGDRLVVIGRPEDMPTFLRSVVT